VFVVGTRPEAIKLIPVIKHFKNSSVFDSVVCSTGQHNEMLRQVFDVFGVEEDYNLAIMRHGASLGDLVSDAVRGLTRVLCEVSPDWVFVHGDTASTLAASIASFLCKFRIAHVEAGLRSYNLDSPWPEEFNRRVTSIATSLHFAPTSGAAANLIREGFDSRDIVVTGNTVIDALMIAADRIPSIESLSLPLDRKIVLVTIHRRENQENGMDGIFEALKKISSMGNVQVVFPIHKSGAVRMSANRLLGGCENIRLIEPLDYLEFVSLMKRSFFIITDSGGIQEEAPALGKPVLVCRDVTERPEAVSAGTALLVGTQCETIVDAALQLLNDSAFYERMSTARNPFGDGRAAERIHDELVARSRPCVAC
jgi:UDP-N-acetylglucosamine 2-epimerase (non-hydrolysing)